MLSMFTTNSTNLVKSKNTPLTAIFARRLVLLVSFLLLGLGSAWGQEYDRIPLDYQGNRIASQAYKAYGDDCFVEFKLTASYDLDPNGYIGQFYNFSNQGHQNISNDSGNKITNGSEFFIRFTIEYLDGIALTSGGIAFSFNHTLNDVNLLVPQSGGFINSNETNAQAFTGTSAPKDRDTDASGTLNFSEIKIPNVTNSSDIKYARIYVTDGSNKKLDYTQNAEGMNVPLLEVTGNTYDYPEGVSAQNGVAVYNGGNTPIDFTVTLNAGIGKLNQYKIVVLLSKSGIDGTGDDAKEPDWDYKYTYTFTYPSSTEEIIVPLDVSILGLSEIKEQRELNIHRDIFDRLYSKDCQLWDGKYLDFVKGWYACWYVTDTNGNKQLIQSSTDIGNNVWTVTNGDQSYCWKFNDNIVWSDNNVDGNTKQQWWVQDYIAAGKTRIATPAGTTFGDYGGYKIVFEITNEYSGGAPNNIPEIKLRYVFEIPSSFTGELRNPEGKAGETLTVDSRSANNKSFTVGNTKISISQPKYARFFVVDAKDPMNPIDSDVKLSVAYNGNVEVKSCIKPIDGFYIFDNKKEIDLNKITITLEASNKYKLYNVIGVFSTELEGAKYDESDETVLTREPDWDLQYTYSFTYNPTTKNYDEQKVEWKRNGIKPVALVDDIDTEWDTSLNELSLGYYVKWYIKNGDQTQPLATGSGRQNGTWTIDVSGFKVNTENEAVLTGTGTFNWNTWGKPTIYAPADKEFAEVEDCMIYCEVYADTDITDKNPYARYTFSLYKSFLGELKVDDNDHKGGETKEELDKNEETVTLDLGTVLASYLETIKTRTPEVVQYARVWLEGTNGNLENPDGKLVIDGMNSYGEENPEYAPYGYYLADNNINEALSGLTATVSLPGVFNKYQVHVALSTDSPTMDSEGKVTAEPDYDYEYTYSFAYHLEIVPTETFPNKAKKDMVKGYGSQMTEKTDVSGSFKLSAITFPDISNMSDIKYARIYVANVSNGQMLDYTSQVNGTGKSLLEVTDGQEAGSEMNGLFVYNEGNPLRLDDFSVTLNAGAGHLEEYKVMVLLSTDPITADGTSPKEPTWDYEYTYKFTYLTEIYERLDDAVLGESSIYITKINEVLKFFGKSADDFAKSWYARWYVTDKDGNRKDIEKTHGNTTSKWAVTSNQYDENKNTADPWVNYRWENDDNNKIVWTDHAGGDENAGWFVQQSLINHTCIAAPNGNLLGSEYAGYKIIFEVTDDNPNASKTGGDRPGAPNPLPDIKLRYIFEIPTPDNFPGQANSSNKSYGSKDISKDVVTDGFTIAEAEDYTNAIKYARIVLYDAYDNLIEDQSKLVVTYDGKPAANAGRRLRNGVYIYDNGNELDKAKINVTLNGGLGNMAKYRIKCLLASSDNGIETEDGRVTHEPNWDYEYEFWFNYIITTKEYTKQVEWRRNGMTPVASTNNLENDWDTSWDELTMGVYVTWYVLGEDGSKQQLAAYNDRRIEGKWAIDDNDYNVSDYEATLRERYTLASTFKSLIYSPNGKDFDDVENHKIICEIYTYSNVAYCHFNNIHNIVPNARYTFTLYNSFLDELKDGGGKIIDSRDLEHGTATLPLTLDKAPNWSSNELKYARVWLTTTDGTLVDPTDKLSVEDMTAFPTEGVTNVRFGYYLYTGDNGHIDPKDIKITLNVEPGFYDQYQVHVALSEGDLDPYPIESDTHEPSYNYLYTFTFSYHVEKKYKTIIYDKENGTCTPHLLRNWQELAGDCNETKSNLESNLYLRWYLGDANGNEIAADITMETDKGYKATNVSHKGYYRKGGFGFVTQKKYEQDAYISTITLPNDYKNNENYKNVRLVCVATTKTANYNADPWTDDPSDIQVMYIYTLKTVEELSNHFVHYQGESYRYRKGLDNTYNPANDGYIQYGDDLEQYTWNIAENDYDASTTTDNIRQNVHTVNYYYYVNGSQNLILPLQDYTKIGEHGLKGNGTEPRAYFRWYDYKTDKESKHLKKHEEDGYVNQLNNQNYNIDELRGLFALRLTAESSNAPNNPSDALVGVDFNPPAGFENSTEEILIACDVSRYLDGMDESFQYLVHEPTLSVRYLFHIRPASYIADEIVNKASANHETKKGLAAVEDKIMNRKPNQKISILENEGRVVLSTNNGFCMFSMRTQLTDLGHYYVYDGDELKKASKLQWYAYYQDENGTWWKHAVGEPQKEIYAQYTLDDFRGSWTQLGGNTTKDITIGVGDFVQVVGCVSSTNGNENMPIIWKELEFIDAAPLELGTETEERTVGYMNSEYKLANTLDFNDLSLYGFKKPASSNENYSPLPLGFDFAQYGYCYPTLYGLCASDYLTFEWDGFGISPLHSDYTLLKSMNMPGVSFDQTWDGQSIYCNWHDDEGKGLLYDVTHERAVGGKATTETEDYGSFLYVDAADEARTIASLQFDAALCSEAKIYYTAYVASMTGGVQTPPMVCFRVTTENALGELVPVVTFVTGDIKEEVNHSGSFRQAQWYQVYGATTLPAELFELLDGSDRTYYVEIDNYCENTDGADYCIDQISFYTNNARLRVKQTGKNCGTDEGVILNVYVNADDLKETDMEGETIFWRICDIDGNPVTDETLYILNDSTKVGHDDNGLPYGQIKVPARPQNDKDIPDEDDFDRSDATSGYFKGIDSTYYFSVAKKGFNLIEGSDYYISVYKLGEKAVKLESFWGHPGDVCSVFSPVFVPQAMYLSVEDGYDSDVSTVVVNCSTKRKTVNLNMVLNLPDKTAELGFRKYKGVRYDYFVGTEELLNNYPLEDGTTTVNLLEAIFDFRDREIEDVQTYNTSYTYETFPESYQKEAKDENYYEAIKWALKKGDLYLTCNPNFQLEIEAGNSTIWAMPVDKYVKHDGINYGICSPLTFTFGVDATGGAPSLVLGFDDVDYTGKGIRVVRVGLEQLQNMQQKDGYLLHIPVNAFQTNDANYSTLEIIDDLELLKYSLDPDQTNDIEASSKNPENPAPIYVARLKGDKVSNDKKYISVNFHQLPETSDNVETFTNFKEGFTYRMFFQVKVEGVEADDVCIGDVEFLLKVVPKYVTWNNGGSVEWNNDRNWTRSTREELHKGPLESNSNSDGYQDNEDLGISGNSAFVPMKFTYVTMPTGNVAPILTELKTLKDDGTDEGIYVNMGSSATNNIQYDMMVRYTEEKCVTEDHEEYNTDTKIYDCEKFYSNWAKEIYFKPGAELVNQHYLTYEKVWVEKKLDAGKWTLMSTPLQNTYAGDMYVPFVNGQQGTEAFKDITFDLKDYSRTKYPIYQRSWGMSEAKVYTKKTTDIRKTDYSALLEFPTTGIDETFAEWSHTYNDVEVPYSKWKGFAIRAHKSDYSGNQPDALIRLPKADDDYNYYQWDNELAKESSDRVISGSLDRAKTGKLFTDKDEVGNGVTHGIKYGKQESMTDGIVNEPISSLQSAFDYQLVGNPYLCSINMETFRTVNAGSLAVDGYWTYNDNKATANLAGVIGPMQSFFVKAKANATIQFTPAMMIDGNNLSTFVSASSMTMTATNDRGQSTASVSVGEEARSVETLFDSNLADVPMVYTVANGQAVSVNQMTELDKPIAFGVTCDSNEPVSVIFSDVAQLTSSEVWVVDAVTGEQTTVTEGSTISVQPNDYGRYFLLAGALNIGDKADVQQGIMVSVRGRMVTVTSGEELTLVRVMSPDGTTVRQYTGGGMTASFVLSPGVYVINAENIACEQQTVKVIVK